MKSENPISDLLNQTIRLFQEISITAQELHGLGWNSGAKRTVLLHLYLQGDISALDLGRLFPIPPVEGFRLVEELVQNGHILRRNPGPSPILTLTLPGRAFAEKMLQAEADFFRQCPVSLPLSNIREAAATLELFLVAMKKSRHVDDVARVVGL
jgi:hypothetical protein